jgi:hypothetical protein
LLAGALRDLLFFGSAVRFARLFPRSRFETRAVLAFFATESSRSHFLSG